MAHLEHSSTSTVELNFIEIVNGFQPLTIFGKSPITVRLGSKYVSVIINLIFTSTTQLYSKTTKINEIFIGNPQFLETTSLHLLEDLFEYTQRQIHVKSITYTGFLAYTQCR